MKPAAVGLIVFLSGCAKESAGLRMEPVASVLELHETMISPASDVIFNVGLDPPEGTAAWTAIRNNALILAESGNLLMIEGHAKDRGPWMEMSKAVIDGVVLAQKAAEAKDAGSGLEGR